MNDFNEFEYFKCPIFIKVIGFGDASKHIVDAINVIGYDGLEASVTEVGEDYMPSENDKMVILLLTEKSEQSLVMAKTYFDADVLTIGITVESDFTETMTVDSLTISAADQMYDVIRTLIDPIFMQGYIGYDFNDLRLTLADTRNFLTISVEGYGEQRFNQAIDSIKCCLTKEQVRRIEQISVFIYFNKDGEHPLITQEVSGLTDFLNELPESINAIWAIYPDDTIKDDGIRISLLAAGKEMVPDRSKQSANLKLTN